MTASISLLGGQEQRLPTGALADHFLMADPCGVELSNTSSRPPNMFAQLLVGPTTHLDWLSQKYGWLPEMAAVTNSSQQGFSPNGSSKTLPVPATSEEPNQLGSRSSGHQPEVEADPSSSRSQIEHSRMPYVSMIRAMLDKDQLAAARALLSVALAESPNATELRRTAEILAAPTSARRPVQDSDRRREFSWLGAYASSHRGQWVAIVGSELVGSATSLTELLESLKSSSVRDLAVIHRVE